MLNIDDEDVEQLEGREGEGGLTSEKKGGGGTVVEAAAGRGKEDVEGGKGMVRAKPAQCLLVGRGGLVRVSL